MTKITIPDTADLLARIAELEAALQEAALSELAAHGQATDAHADAIRLRASLDEIIMEATSRNHAIDIARRAREGRE